MSLIFYFDVVNSYFLNLNVVNSTHPPSSHKALMVIATCGIPLVLCCSGECSIDNYTIMITPISGQLEYRTVIAEKQALQPTMSVLNIMSS